jgi:nucleoside-diphosphate-sugar epimerase
MVADYRGNLGFMSTPKILITGACGQIGTELVKALRAKYGEQKVIATDIHDLSRATSDKPYYTLDVLNLQALDWIVSKHNITQIYHLAAVLSASGEKNPIAGWNLNMQGLLNVLEVSRKYKIERVFWPSSIAVFGPGSPKAACPQSATTDPATIYGISKVAGESWCRYYGKKYDLDIRSVRYPGLISHSADAGGGTTDYAVEIFHKAIEEGHYTSFLRCDTCLPMLYMEDAIRGTLELMEAPRKKITINTSYNLAGISFTPAQLYLEIRKHLPDFCLNCEPDERQVIADSWPSSIDDRHARADWNWNPRYDLEGMVNEMLGKISAKKLSESASIISID